MGVRIGRKDAKCFWFLLAVRLSTPACTRTCFFLQRLSEIGKFIAVTITLVVAH
jgi:hypothetical protein